MSMIARETLLTDTHARLKAKDQEIQDSKAVVEALSSEVLIICETGSVEGLGGEGGRRARGEGLFDM